MGVVVTITEQSGKDLVDYPVKVVITDPQFFEECPDKKYIECYFQDGSWIPHFTELFDPVNNIAVILVKVPQIPANGTVKVFIKVNPSRTEDLSNGYAVFEFFDDFESLDNWDVHESAGNVRVENSLLILDGSTSATAGINGVRSKVTFSKPAMLELKLIATYVRSGWAWRQWGFTNAELTAGQLAQQNIVLRNQEVGGYTYFRVAKDGASTQVGLDPITSWHVETIVWGDVARNYWNNELKAEITTNIPDIPLYIGIGVGNNAGAEAIKCDWVGVRRYVEPEPAVTVEYISETVTYSDYFYWGMAKMLSGAIANFMQLPIKMEIYSGSSLLKTLSLKEISTITDEENRYIVSVLKFEDDSSDGYQTDKQIVYVTDPDGNTRKLAESTYVFIKITELPLLLGFEIRTPYEDSQVLLP